MKPVILSTGLLLSAVLGAQDLWPPDSHGRLQTAFKMTVYDIQGSDPKPMVAALSFGEDDWADFWRNKGGRQDAMIAAWRRLFEHFKNEPSIAGYDLLNESKRTKLGVDDQTFAATYLVPYYRRLIDILHQIDPRQWVLFQPGVGVAVMPPLERERIVYAPHMYTDMLQYLANNGTPDLSAYAPPPCLLQ